MQHIFDTPGPASVYVEIGSGDVDVRAEDTAQTVVDVDGRHADEVNVERQGGQIVVLAPRRTGFFGSNDGLRVRISLPTGSELAAKLSSAEVRATGRLATAQVRTGSGDVRLAEVAEEALVETGSGDVEIGTVGDLRVKSGSGDVEVAHLGAGCTISTGSGDVVVDEAVGLVRAKSGSGSLRVRTPQGGVELGTASGDLYVDRVHRGQVAAKNVSGDIHVGVPAGIPVWTDLTCLSGSVSSSLQGAGRPAEDQDYVELRARTVSGDIRLEGL